MSLFSLYCKLPSPPFFPCPKLGSRILQYFSFLTSPSSHYLIVLTPVPYSIHLDLAFPMSLPNKTKPKKKKKTGTKNNHPKALLLQCNSLPLPCNFITLPYCIKLRHMGNRRCYTPCSNIPLTRPQISLCSADKKVRISRDFSLYLPYHCGPGVVNAKHGDKEGKPSKKTPLVLKRLNQAEKSRVDINYHFQCTFACSTAHFCLKFYVYIIAIITVFAVQC